MQFAVTVTSDEQLASTVCLSTGDMHYLLVSCPG